MIINKKYPNETPEEREERLAKTRVRDRKWWKERSQRETPEQRAKRLERKRATLRAYYAKNREKELKRTAKYRKENIEKERERKRIYRVKNREKVLEGAKKWRNENREKVRERHRLYGKNNRGKRNALNAKRNAAKLERTPAWVTEEEQRAIANLFIEAQRRTRATGVTHHVHHIYELQGKTVSGLHVFENLVIMPEKAHYACHSRRARVKEGYNYTSL